MAYDLRWYQQEIAPTIFDYFVAKQGNPVIAWPTGTGKSLIPSLFIIEVLRYYPTQRFMIVTHVKELIEQNASKMRDLWPGAPIGVYSAGLGQRDTAQPIIFAGIASVAKCAQLFGHRDILFIDECHLLSIDDDTMYQIFIAELRKINPYLKVIGLSATPFRLGQGLITEGGLFTDVIHDLTTYENFNRLIAEGFLSPPVPRPTKTKLDLKNVGIARGEFKLNELQAAIDVEATTFKALQETCELGHDRHSWLIFASGVDHAEHIATQLVHFGVSCEAVHSKMKKEERDRRIADFKSGKLRAISNNNVLTTGFDHPPIDLIVMLRPTLSPGLWVQMLGRGTRPYDFNNPGNVDPTAFPFVKKNCLVLDFARNTKALGPINDPKIPKKKGDKPGDVPVKICDECGTYNHARATHCINCGAEFSFKEKIKASSSTDALLRDDANVPSIVVETFNLKQVTYAFHQKEGKPPVIKVQYECEGSKKFNEWVCLESGGYAERTARQWWRQRANGEPPTTTVDALKRLNELKVPRRVRVHTNLKYPQVLGCEY